MTYGIIPMVSQPAMYPGDSRSFGLGDSTFFGYFVPPNEGKLIWGFGPALQAPTATGSVLGSNKWAAGPSSIFALFDNVWDFAGPGDQEVNAFNLQYQAAIQDRKAGIPGLRPGGLQRDQARWRFHLAGDRGAGFNFLKALEHIYATPLFF